MTSAPRRVWASTPISVVVAAVVVVILVVIAVIRLSGGGGFAVGDSRSVTVLVGECWRPEVKIDGGTWKSPSSDPAPASWGHGPEPGVIERTGEVEAVFTATDGKSVSIFGSELHDAACPLRGRDESGPGGVRQSS